MMAEFIDVELDDDPDALSDDALTYLADNVPGFDASEGNLETWVIRAGSRVASDIRSQTGVVPAAIFRKFGTDLVNLPTIDNVPATAATTWTMTDTLGHTIPAGTVAYFAADGDRTYPFQTVEDVVVAPAASATGAGEVIMQQVLVEGEGGDAGNGLTAAPQLQDNLAFVDHIAIVGTTESGEDAETDDEYLNRLRTRLQLLSPAPIVERDYAVLAQDVDGVTRAVAIDTYNPDDSTLMNPGYMAVAAIDDDGAAVGVGVKAAIVTALEAVALSGIVVKVFDATYTTVNVTFSAVVIDGYDPDEVEDDAEAAVAAYLDPSSWGQPSEGDQREWQNVTVVRWTEVVSLIDRVPGIDYVTALALNGGGVGANVTLTGAAPLPEAGTVVGTVTAP